MLANGSHLGNLLDTSDLILEGDHQKDYSTQVMEIRILKHFPYKVLCKICLLIAAILDARGRHQL